MTLTRRPWLLAVIMLPGFAAYLGVQFDVAWHIDRGRDHFDIPPHLMMLAGVQLSGLAFLLISLATTRRVRSGQPVTTPVARYRGRPYSPLAIAGLLCVLAPGVVIGLDEGWHRLFGLDVSAWSPTHLTALYTAAFAGFMLSAYLAAELNHLVPDRASAGLRRLRDLDARELWLLYTLSLFGAGLLVMLIEYDFDVPQFDLAFMPPLLAALSAFPVFCALAALGTRFSATLAGASIVALKLVVVAVLLAGGRTHPDVAAGIVAGALAADLTVLLAARHGARPARGLAAALAAYPVALLAAEWVRLELLGQPQWTEGLWPLGAPLALPAAMLAGALGLRAGFALRPAGAPATGRGPHPTARPVGAGLAALVLLAPLVLAVPAAAHSGYSRETVLSTLETSPARPAPGDRVRIRLTVGERTLRGDPAPFLDARERELGAYRAGVWISAPLRRTGARSFEGSLRLAEPGHWVVWPRFTVGDERWIDRTLIRVEAGAGAGGTRAYVTEIAPEADPRNAPEALKPLGFLVMALIWGAVTLMAVRALRLVERFGPATAGERA